jgi:hypothetical protein
MDLAKMHNSIPNTLYDIAKCLHIILNKIHLTMTFIHYTTNILSHGRCELKFGTGFKCSKRREVIIPKNIDSGELQSVIFRSVLWLYR